MFLTQHPISNTDNTKRRLIRRRPINKLIAYCLPACLAVFWVSGLVYAESSSLIATGSVRVEVSRQPTLLIQLEARQSPLDKILKAIADKTGATIHYSVLPEAPVTATCVGADVGQIMDCLVAKQIGLVAHKAQKNKPAEFWLLGSSVGSCPAVTIASLTLQAQTVEEPQPTVEQLAAIDEGNKNQTDALLEKFKNTKDKGERAEALNNLVSVGKIDDANVRNALEDAMMDKDDSIRAQAVETFANLDKDNATDYLNRALQDKSAEVRIAALGKAVSHPDILERALSDSDNNVSQYAASLLEQIKKQSER